MLHVMEVLEDVVVEGGVVVGIVDVHGVPLVEVEEGLLCLDYVPGKAVWTYSAAR